MMITLKKTSKYQESRDKFVKNNVKRGEALIKTIRLLVENPMHPSLHLEKLIGSGVWTIRIDSGNRIYFIWIDKNTVLLIDIGPHDKYRRY